MVRDKVILPLLFMVCANLEIPLLQSDEGGKLETDERRRNPNNCGA